MGIVPAYFGNPPRRGSSMENAESDCRPDGNLTSVRRRKEKDRTFPNALSVFMSLYL